MPEPQSSVPSTPSGVQDFFTKTNPFVDLVKDVKANFSDKVDNPAAAKKAPVVKDVGSYKSLVDLQAHGYGQDKKTAQFFAARQQKQPEKAPTPSLYLQAVSGKLQRIYQSQDYQSLRPENQLKIKAFLYNKYIVPSFKANGLEPPILKEWLENQGSPTTRFPQGGEKKTNFGEFESAAVSSAADMTRLVGRLTKYSMQHASLPGQPQTAAAKYTQSQAEKVIDFANKVQKVSLDYDNTFEAKHDISGWLANFGGHIVGDAPAYIAAGELIPSLAEKAAMSPAFKVAYSSLKASGEVFGVNRAEGQSFGEAAKNAAAAFLFGSALHGAVLKFSGAKLATGGMPMVNKVSELADHEDLKEVQALAMSKADYDQTKLNAEWLSEHKGVKALVNDKDPDIHKAVSDERAMREQIAREFHPEKATGDKSIWRNLSKGQRQKVKDYITASAKASAEVMPLANPEVQTVANSTELARAAKEDPVFAQRMAAVEKMTGLSVAQTLTEIQAKEVERETGIGSPAHILEESLGERGEQLFGENPARVKGARTVSNRGLLNPLIPNSLFVENTQKYLEHTPATKSGKVYFENPEHHLLWIANHSDAPDNIKKAAAMRLRRDFGLTADKIKERGDWLAEHVSDLGETGKLSSEGNVYRSTVLNQRRYARPWSKTLYTDDLLAADLQDLKKLTKARPELKQPIEDLLDTLNRVRNKAQTPAVSRLRRTTQKQLIDILEEYK